MPVERVPAGSIVVFRGCAFPVRDAILFICACVLVLGTSSRAPAQQERRVDLELVLAVDCSYSVDEFEFALQVQGMARAFRHPEIIEAIAGGPLKSIAVAVVQWSDADTQSVVVPWTAIGTRTESHAFADRVAGMARAVPQGGTSISSVIRFSAGLLADNGFFGARQVIDVAADGRNNSGGNPRIMRDIVAARGIVVNGLTVLNEDQALDKYFERNVRAGPGSFVIIANDYDAYEEAILRKLLREIMGPATS